MALFSGGTPETAGDFVGKGRDLLSKTAGAGVGIDGEAALGE